MLNPPYFFTLPSSQRGGIACLPVSKGQGSVSNSPKERLGITGISNNKKEQGSNVPCSSNINGRKKILST
jgi:hypothetical protein